MAKNLGIDIGSSSIKILELDGSGMVLSHTLVANPVYKNVSSMTNSEKLLLVETLKKSLSTISLKSTKTILSIPESLVYAKIMKFPKMSTPELATAIRWELDQNVPFPPSEIEMAWSLMEGFSKEKGVDELFVYVVAVPTKISEAYVQIFDLLEIEIERLENESTALQRSFLNFVPDGGLAMVLDFGFSGTNIVLINKDSIVNSYYYSVGGSAITKLISESFGLTPDQAENYKRTYGLIQDQLDGKMFTLLKPIIDNLVLEIKKMLIAYKNDYGDMGDLRVMLSGGGSFLSQLPAYLSSSLDGSEVLMGNVLEGKSDDASLLSYGSIFSISNGLAVEL